MRVISKKVWSTMSRKSEHIKMLVESMGLNKDKESWFEENGLYDVRMIGEYHFLARYNVAFGVRVRGGLLYDFGCGLDVCCGAEDSFIKRILDEYEKKALETLKTNPDNPFEGLRAWSEIKPVHNDLDYMKWFEEMVNGE